MRSSTKRAIGPDRNWETTAAVRGIAGSLGISSTRFGYASSKDKGALTRS